MEPVLLLHIVHQDTTLVLGNVNLVQDIVNNVVALQDAKPALMDSSNKVMDLVSIQTICVQLANIEMPTELVMNVTKVSNAQHAVLLMAVTVAHLAMFSIVFRLVL